MKEFLISASNAGDIESTFELGKLYLERGQIKDGEKLIEQAAEKNYTAAIIEFAKIKQNAGDFQKALELFKKAIRAGNVSVLENAVNICEEKKDFATLKKLQKLFNLATTIFIQRQIFSAECFFTAAAIRQNICRNTCGR